MTLEEHLKRTQYHWILGLRELKEPCYPNLWDQIHSLQSDEILHFRNHQAEIQQKIWPLRFFYWLFNLSNYAKYHYQIAAYDQVYNINNEGVPMHKLQPNKSSYLDRLKQWFRRTPSQTTTPSTHPPSTKNNVTEPDEPKNAHTHAPQDAPQMTHPVEVSNSDEELLVQPWMQSALNLLGIERLNQHTLRSSEIRKAYLLQALAFHPDKNPSPEAHAMFIKIVNAYEILRSAFGGTVTQNEMSSYKYTDIWQELAELRHGINSLNQGWKNLSHYYEKEISKLLERQRELEDLRQFIRKNKQETEELYRMFDEQNQMIDEQNQKLDEINQIFDEQNRKLDEINRFLNEKDKKKNELLIKTDEIGGVTHFVDHKQLPFIEHPLTSLPNINKRTSRKSLPILSHYHTKKHEIIGSSPQKVSTNHHAVALSTTHATVHVQPEMQSLLTVLGINRPLHNKLFLSELNKAYRTQAIIFHPDKNQTAKAKDTFIRITQAYETLMAQFSENNSEHVISKTTQLHICDNPIKRLSLLVQSKYERHPEQSVQFYKHGIFAGPSNPEAASDEQPAVVKQTSAVPAHLIP